MESKISPSSVLIRKPNLIYNEIDGEVVILSIDNSEYYSLNSIGSEIWRLLDKPKTFDEIIDTLLDEFEVDKKTCIIDTTSFIEEFLKKGIVQIRS